MQILDLSTGVATPLNLIGTRPKWSPLGNRIAYVANNRVWVVSPDGSGATAVSPVNALFQPGLAWSPDGAWLLVLHQPVSWSGATRMALLSLATGELIPLPPGFARFANPAWRPVP